MSVGYITQEIRWDGQPLNVTLKNDTQKLDEVVVTALGIKRPAISGRNVSVRQALTSGNL